jgi:hypothetical protein
MEVGMPDVILRWLQYMSTFDIEVEYRPGQNHGNADALSRPPVPCEARGCICQQAHGNMLHGQSTPPFDGEPDFESCPGVPTPRSRLIGLVTRSGRLIGEECEPELDDGDETTVGPGTDPWGLLQSQPHEAGSPGEEKGKTGPPGEEKDKTRPGHPVKRKTRPGHLAKKMTRPGHPVKKKTRPGHQVRRKTRPSHPVRKKTRPGHPARKKTRPGHPVRKKTRPGLPARKLAGPGHPVETRPGQEGVFPRMRTTVRIARMTNSRRRRRPEGRTQYYKSD